MVKLITHIEECMVACFLAISIRIIKAAEFFFTIVFCQMVYHLTK